VRKRSANVASANVLSVRKRSVSGNCFICAKAKRQQQQMFSVAKAKRQLQMFSLRESEASAANVLSVRKRSDSNKAPSRNGNQPHVLVKSPVI